MAIIIVALVLSFLVIIHELGHFLAARKSSITVEEFGIGYPPKALSLTKLLGSSKLLNSSSFLRKCIARITHSKTELTINWIPFGGFVRMAGETPSLEHEHRPSVGDFLAASIWQRLFVICAGVVVNFVFGIIAFTIVFSKTGIPETIPGARIAVIADGSPAAQAHIPVGVQIFGFTFDNTYVETPEITDVQRVVSEHLGQTAEVKTSDVCSGLVCDGQQEFQVYLRTKEETPEDQGSLGVGFDQIVFQQYPWYEMPFRGTVKGLEQAVELSKLILLALINVGRELTHGKVSQDVAGPVGIVYQAQQGQFFDQGFLSILSFAGVLSINLAIMNILPFPPLDGGRAMTTILEVIIGKKRSRKVEYYANYAGYIILILLIVLITFSDIGKIIFGG